MMIRGNKSEFAIESGITRAYSRLSLRALGYFVVHLAGRCYGVRSPNASMLANSYDEVQERILHRGRHVAPFSLESDAEKIANAFREVFHGDEGATDPLLGLPRPQLRHLIISNHLRWAPDGDAAFDDGSHILHFDCGERIRLIGYMLEPWREDYKCKTDTLSDVWLETDRFYHVLERWREGFYNEWTAAPKVTETNE